MPTCPPFPSAACSARSSLQPAVRRGRRRRPRAPRNHATLAMVAEPQTLDPMASTADLVGTIMQHVYEPLYTFDAKWNVVPMLAEAMPKVSADGKTYSITLRKGVMLHNGRELNADDVVASLQRWMEQSPRGKAVGKELESLKAKGAARRRAGAQAALCAAARRNSRCRAAWPRSWPRSRSRTPLSTFVGTGPYSFKERKPDQYVLLTRFDKYSARKEPAERLRRQARGGDRRAAFRAGAQRQHARRGCTRRAVRLRRPAAGGGAGAAGEERRQDACRS